MDYGFDIKAIIGFDLLSSAKITMDTGNHTLGAKNKDQRNGRGAG